jgi:hypothetical protein
MAFAHLKSAGITDNERLDFARTKTTMLASEKIKDDLFRQLHHITFTENSGNNIEVITVNNASTDECSMSGIDVYPPWAGLSHDYWTCPHLLRGTGRDPFDLRFGLNGVLNLTVQ